MDAMKEQYVHLSQQVMDWAGRIARHEDTVDEVSREMASWIAGAEDRRWSLAVCAVGCFRDMMHCAVAHQSGGLVVAQEGSWFVGGMGGPRSREPDVVAMVQAAIAMANQDADMATDILLAHERVGGPAGMFGIIRAATHTVAGMLELGVTVQVGGNEVLSDWRF